ncbi:MAG: polyamine ABC transporter substrate-binding protein, partial [Gammaproteobacteria bacterium]|nr:polyamine ABC transporter substrate-binding protein [Gammaproteobacteria bacterium]
AGGDEEKVLNIYNWSDYIAEDTIPNFEKETGIKVRYDVFDSNEVLEAKMLAGKTGYDLVVPTANFLARQVQAGVFQKLDKSKLTNYGNLDPEMMKTLSKYDPDNAYSVPWMWGTTGVGYNVAKIKERMPDAPIGSWDLVLKPENAAKFADCGLTVLDAPTEIMASILKYQGKDPASEDPKDLEAAEALMMQLRPHIKYFHSSQYINDLANGEICLAIGWSGDVFIAQSRAKEAGQGTEIGYYIPDGGAEVWFDLVAIPADAPHPNNAHLFLNYILRPEVVAEISNFVTYANANAAATQFVDDEIKNNPAIYPPPEVKAKLFPNPIHTAEYDRLLTRAWTRIKTGE